MVGWLCWTGRAAPGQAGVQAGHASWQGAHRHAALSLEGLNGLDQADDLFVLAGATQAEGVCQLSVLLLGLRVLVLRQGGLQDNKKETGDGSRLRSPWGVVTVATCRPAALLCPVDHAFYSPDLKIAATLPLALPA